MSKFYQVTIFKSVEIDDFKDGCLPDTFQDHGEVYRFKSSDLDLVAERVKHFIDLKGCEVFENRIEVSRLEIDDGSEPSQACIDAWKKGSNALKAFNTKMWLANYTIMLETVETTEVNAGQLLG